MRSLAAVPLALLAAWTAGDERTAAWRARLTDDGRRPRLEDVSGLDCLRCHAAVGDEWRDSAHAFAWQDEHYQRALRETRRSQREHCAGCHVPSPLAAQEHPDRPAPRADDRHLGVACAACHLDADGATVLGPLGLATDAHATRRSEVFDAGGRGCLACHSTTIGPVVALAPDYVASGQAELETCVDCHMPRVTGPLANDPESGAPGPERARRSHRLNTPRDPEFLASAFTLRASVRDGAAVLTIANRAGHRVPGTTERRLTFRVRLVDSFGDVVDEREHVIDARAFLAVDGEVEVPLRRTGVRLEVEALHATTGLRRPVRFLEESLPLE